MIRRRRTWKAHAYRYLGVYLATTEENDYIQSKEFWSDFLNHINHPENDMEPIDIQGLLIGLWQAERGYCRIATRYFLKSPRLIFCLLDLVACFWATLVSDLRQLFRP